MEYDFNLSFTSTRLVCPDSLNILECYNIGIGIVTFRKNRGMLGSS
jgi:hypothetical protein